MVLWIDGNTFAADLIQRVFKSRSLPFYTIPDVRDFAYLVEDLLPELIVIDGDTARKDLGLLREQYERTEALRRARFVVIGSWEGLDFIEGKKGPISRELDPFKVPELLREFRP